jgi:multidrug efflux system outer membrane protein
MKRRSFLLLIGLALAQMGCTLAPKYNRPPAPVPAAWPAGPSYPEMTATTNAPAAAAVGWRQFFTDEELQQLVERALTNNRDLRLAALNVERAWALFGIQRGELLPTVNAVASGNKQETPADLSNAGRRQTTDRYDVNLSMLAWEIDFFGRIRSLKDRALEEFLATEQARRGAQILLASSVANAYLALAADREKLALARTTVDALQETYDLVKRRHALGLTPETDLLRAQAQLDAGRGDIARFIQVVAQDVNALNLLAGGPVDNLLSAGALSDVTVPEEILPGISSEVLLTRPDVLQAESLLKAANADIGAARAALFPRISLTAAFGTASSELSGLFDSESEAWSFIPRITMPIFDTRTWSAVKVTKVQQQIVLTQYERAVQTAFREVADALAVRGSVDRQIAAQESFVKAISESYRLSKIRYDRGIDSYFTVLDAQRSMYAAQQALVSLRLAKVANLVQLYAVLGGGGD